MNGISFQESEVRVGSSAKFLFEPECNQRSIPTIADFQGGQKAYAVIEEAFLTEVVLRIGEYIGDTQKVPEGIWRLRYHKKKRYMENC